MVTYKIIYTVKQAANLLYVSEEELWELIKFHRLKYVLVCERVMIRGIDLEIFVNTLSPL